MQKLYDFSCAFVVVSLMVAAVAGAVVLYAKIATWIHWNYGDTAGQLFLLAVPFGIFSSVISAAYAFRER